MYQPISFEVVRQACAWHDFPAPKLRQLSFHENEDGIVWAEYFATWPSTIIREKYHWYSQHDDGGLTFRAHLDLQRCFCDDVVVRHFSLDPTSTYFSCILYIQIDTCVFGAVWG